MPEHHQRGGSSPALRKVHVPYSCPAAVAATSPLAVSCERTSTSSREKENGVVRFYVADPLFFAGLRYYRQKKLRKSTSAQIFNKCVMVRTTHLSVMCRHRQATLTGIVSLVTTLGVVLCIFDLEHGVCTSRSKFWHVVRASVDMASRAPGRNHVPAYAYMLLGM